MVAKKKVTKKKAAARPVGRPTTQTAAMVKAAKDYLNNYEDHDDVMPSVVGMALVLGVSTKTLYNWSEVEGSEFLHILDNCKSKQERVLLNQGLSGNFNSAITKLALGKHGYHDKVDGTLGGGDKPLAVQSIERTIVKPR